MGKQIKRYTWSVMGSVLLVCMSCFAVATFVEYLLERLNLR